MATSITRKSALSAAIIAFDYLNFEGVQIEGITEDYSDIKETLGKMLEQVSKPRAKAISKARKGNEALAQWVYDHAGDVVTTKDIVAMGKPEIATTQKAAAVLRVACEMGLFTKGDGKKVAYAKVYSE